MWEPLEILLSAAGFLRPDDIVDLGDLDSTAAGDLDVPRSLDQIVVAAGPVRTEPKVEPPESAGDGERAAEMTPKGSFVPRERGRTLLEPRGPEAGIHFVEGGCKALQVRRLW